MAKTNNSDFFTKMDIVQIWGMEHIAKFVRLVGEDKLKGAVGWKRGYQLFSPNQVRAIIELVGEPIHQRELQGIAPKKEKV